MTVFARNIFALLVLTFAGLSVNSFAQGTYQPNPNSPYPTLGDGQFYIRSFNNPTTEFAPKFYYDKVDEANGVTNFTYRASRRDTPGKPKIFTAFSNWLKPGLNRFALGFNWNAYWTTNNLVVLAEGLPSGGTGATFLAAVQEDKGVKATLSNGACLTANSVKTCAPQNGNATVFLPKDDDGMYTDAVALEVNLVAGRNCLALVGRPTNTDSCPTCEFGVTIGLLEGTAEATPMLGDNLAWMWRLNAVQLWAKLNQNARGEYILDPWTGRQVSATGQEVANFLRTLNPYGDEVRRTMNAAVLSQLVCLANNLDPDTAQIGQKTAADPEAWRSSADDPTTVGDTVLTGACSVTSFAQRVRRAYTDFQSDGNDRADFLVLSRYLAQW